MIRKQDYIFNEEAPMPTESNLVKAQDSPIFENPTIKSIKDNWKSKNCRVISCNQRSGVAVVDFDGKHIQMSIPDDMTIGNNILVKYKGAIGKNLEVAI